MDKYMLSVSFKIFNFALRCITPPHHWLVSYNSMHQSVVLLTYVTRPSTCYATVFWQNSSLNSKTSWLFNEIIDHDVLDSVTSWKKTFRQFCWVKRSCHWGPRRWLCPWLQSQERYGCGGVMLCFVSCQSGGHPHDPNGCPDHDNTTRRARLCHTTAFCPASVCQQKGRHAVAASITAKLHLNNIHQNSYTQRIFCVCTCALSIEYSLRIKTMFLPRLGLICFRNPSLAFGEQSVPSQAACASWPNSPLAATWMAGV